MKRKLLALLIAAALVFAMFPCTALALDTWDGTADTSWYNGGSSYTISTAEQLAGLAILVNQGAAESGDMPVSFSGVTITLGDDINLAGHDWTPIGLWQWSGPDYPFSGTFDGNGHTISNMTVNDPSRIGVGLFGYTTGATIDSLGVINCDVTGEAAAGGLAGLAEDNSSIYNCYTTGTVKVVCYDSDIGYDGQLAGGLVGIYGESPSTIDGCWSSADVDGERGRIGGLVGGCVLGRIINSYATGTIGSPTSEAYTAGGFIGMCDRTVIENCYATGSVTCSENAGGFIGDTYSSGAKNQITNCYARGNVTACYTDSDDGSQYGLAAGGFIGTIADTDISNCYSTGYISYAPATEAYNIGGFAGELEWNYTFTNCFVDTQAAGRGAVGNGDDGTSAAYTGITGLTTANMQGWDALVNTAKADGLDSGAGASVWYAHSGASYPDFEPESCDITFNSQGATTPAAPSPVTATVGLPVGKMPEEPVRIDFNFGGWWTGTLGTGSEFTGSTPVPGDMTVYALWLRESSSSVYVGARVTLAHVGPAGGDWDYDGDYVMLEDLENGTVRITGVAAGTTQVTYTTSETIETFDITVLDSELPATGQDDTLVYLMGGSALLILSAGIAAWILGIRKRAKQA